MRSFSLLILASLTALAVAKPVDNEVEERGADVTYTIEDMPEVPADGDLPDILERHPTKTGLLRARWCSGPVTRSCSSCLRSGNCYKLVK